LIAARRPYVAGVDGATRVDAVARRSKVSVVRSFCRSAAACTSSTPVSSRRSSVLRPIVRVEGARRSARASRARPTCRSCRGAFGGQSSEDAIVRSGAGLSRRAVRTGRAREDSRCPLRARGETSGCGPSQRAALSARRCARPRAAVPNTSGCLVEPAASSSSGEMPKPERNRSRIFAGARPRRGRRTRGPGRGSAAPPELPRSSRAARRAIPADCKECSVISRHRVSDQRCWARPRVESETSPR